MTRICSDDKADENVSLCWCLAHRICSAIYPSIHAMESRRVSGQVADSFVRLQVSLLSGVLRATIPGACRTWQTSSRSNRLHSTLWASRWRQHCSCNPAAKDSCKWECVCFVLSLGSDRVVTWGHADCGGDSSRVQDQLQNVQQICGRWNCGDLGRSTLWRWQLQSPRCAQLPLGAGRQKRPYRVGGNHLAGWDRLGITANSYLCGPDVPKSITYQILSVLELPNSSSNSEPMFRVLFWDISNTIVLDQKIGYPKNSLVYDQHDQGDQHMGL